MPAPVVSVPPRSDDAQDAELVDLLVENAVPLPPISGAEGDGFGRHFDRFGDCRILLIGDASHGTSEFYAARAEITKHMIEQHGFNIVATESDWPDAELVDRYVRHRPGPAPRRGTEVGGTEEKADHEPAFMKFPTWMWRNMEVHDFVEWLRVQNTGKKTNEAVGFYGLDLYSMKASMMEVIAYLDQVDAKMAKVARTTYASLMPWAEHPHEYGMQALVKDFESHEKEMVQLLQALLSKRIEYSAHYANGNEFHGGEQNGRIVAGKYSGS